MTHSSATDLLVLHAVRLKGFADTAALAARFDLDPDQTGEDLLDAQAYGWVGKSSFAGLTGWSLTDRGRTRNEAQLRAELDQTAARKAVATVHDQFLPLNGQALAAFTAWQLDQPSAAVGWWGSLAEELRGIEHDLVAQLARFGGYHTRFAAAAARAAGDPSWITGVEVDSCHRVWFELHEDLIATLGITR
ncbi:transcriptional regulator [Actinoplanes sp. NPDC051859]|uniref:transcriptional regulator n=1 Tax=Actinoplanes sp. NPDC051859 TaxID=3363909 RepID=UPI0037B07614